MCTSNVSEQPLPGYPDSPGTKLTCKTNVTLVGGEGEMPVNKSNSNSSLSITIHSPKAYNRDGDAFSYQEIFLHSGYEGRPMQQEVGYYPPNSWIDPGYYYRFFFTKNLENSADPYQLKIINTDGNVNADTNRWYCATDLTYMDKMGFIPAKSIRPSACKYYSDGNQYIFMD